jgi:copper chaperone
MNGKDSESVRLRVSGMTCDDCVRHVKKAIMSLDGVLDANVDLKQGDARIVYRPEKVRPEDILSLRIFRPPSHYSAAIEER